MTKKIEPHLQFTVWSPDEVAECLEGVGVGELYRTLWSLVDKVPDLGETPDTRFGRALAKVWRELTTDDQQKLNELAEAHDRKYGLA